jgi:hypothetical protein
MDITARRIFWRHDGMEENVERQQAIVHDMVP